MKKPICEVKKCLLDDREEDISQYIDDEILALIQRLELKHPDVHPGCLRVKVKKYLDYNSVKILMDLTLEHDLAKKRSGVSQ
jgi:hypothetical protein